MRSPVLLIVSLPLLSLFVLLLALIYGSTEVGLHAVIASVTGKATAMQDTIIWNLRFPRAATAFVAGGLLALAGSLMQTLLRNPLADPYILGVSGGAAVGALISIQLGCSGFWISHNAFLGALVSMFAVFALAKNKEGWNSLRLLLTGVIIAAGWGAIVSFILATNPTTRIHSMLFWMMGDLSNSTLPSISFGVLIGGLLLSTLAARQMNLLIQGELQARALGVSVDRLRIALYFLASLLTATAVTLAGTIGFIGLIVPHLLRMLGARDHRLLLPCATIFGGTLLMAADTLARTLIAPQQLPVGVITAMIGVPMFLLIMQRGGRL